MSACFKHARKVVYLVVVKECEPICVKLAPKLSKYPILGGCADVADQSVLWKALMTMNGFHRNPLIDLEWRKRPLVKAVVHIVLPIPSSLEEVTADSAFAEVHDLCRYPRWIDPSREE